MTSKRIPVRKDAGARFSITTGDGPDGETTIGTITAAREIAARVNRTRNLAAHPDQAVRAGDLNAAALIDEIMHHVVGLYESEFGGEIFAAAGESAAKAVGSEQLTECVSRYGEIFAAGDAAIGDAAAGAELLEELLLLWVENENPACGPFAELYHDADLRSGTAYLPVLGAVREHLANEPPFGPEQQPLTEMLTTPARLYPDSLVEQLGYIREHWGSFLGDYMLRLLRGLDYLREERKVGFAGPGPARTYTYSGFDPERFSPDKDWMPNVVLIAKSTLVWLDQLSRTYNREVRRLDQVPDEELDRLASYGVNALWLIGLWERSAASRRIKHIGGNPEAEASAYALREYEIADALGGWDALGNLRERCWARGIRMASDMVPNHTGIDGRWVTEHPDWFIQSEQPPFPGYSFSGEDLSPVEGVGIHLEDHYYDRSDAAVVFRRIDYGSGHERFIYHGNDGTSMPWNDTAQLNFLNAEVREAVIRTILHVARNFPIIRFDAAMTLARKHIRRLWFPAPGSGGDIPSRAQFGLTDDEFDAAIPEEFWREVVDRVAAEVPDTLLLAEAFWMMEGYFVRTLGMHRVYNSAFMNMLKNEDNQKYRQTIKNTLEFDKGILKRFVNFMNNPDEDTAVAQFGKGDKYFGVCTLMLTMPGLPMIGHGQIEGFSEKYGMEFSRAYQDEKPDEELVARHEREIFPLMHARGLFSGVENFLLYDLYTDSAVVNENVFAYSNSAGGERSLVLYNNAYERAWGRIRESAGYVEKVNGDREHRRETLGNALQLHKESGYFCLLREVRSGLWYIRRSREVQERGMAVSLDGYQAQVFLNIHEVRDNEFSHYAQLSDELAGAGVPDLEEALRDIALRPLLDLFTGVANSGTYAQIAESLTGTAALPEEDRDRLTAAYGRFLREAGEFRRTTGEEERAGEDMLKLLLAVTTLPYLDLTRFGGDVVSFRKAVNECLSPIRERADVRDILLTWVFTAPLSHLYQSAAGITGEWGLARRAARAFAAEPDPSWTRLLRLLLAYRDWPTRFSSAGELLASLAQDAEATTYLGFNEYEGTVWFNHERFAALTWWFYTTAVIDLCAREDPGAPGDTIRCASVMDLRKVLEDLRAAEEASGFKVAALLDGAK